MRRLSGRARRNLDPWRVAGAVILAILLVFALGPVLWTIGMSLKPGKAVFSGSWSFQPTLRNYHSVLSSPFPTSLVHSVIIDVGATVVTMAVALPGAYALVRQARRRVFRLMIDYNYLIRLLPGLMILVPLFEVFRDLHLLNSYVGMILAYQVFGIPIAMATLLGFFAEVPRELEEAAIVDGATALQAFAKVALPLVRSGAIATAVLVFVIDWTEFLFALVLTGQQTQTAPVAILDFLKYSSVDWGALAGATVILMLPSVLLSLGTGRLFVRGLTSGAIK